MSETNRLLFLILNQRSEDQHLIRGVVDALIRSLISSIEEMVLAKKIQLHEHHPITLTQKLIQHEFSSIPDQISLKQFRKILSLLGMLI